MDKYTQEKWDKAAPHFDIMAGGGAEKRWKPFKQKLFSNMEGNILFLALGTGLDIPTFPKGKNITAINTINCKQINGPKPLNISIKVM